MRHAVQPAFIAASLILGLTSAAHAWAFDRHVDVVNDSHQAIVGFYASNVSSGDWQEDILGAKTLPPGYQVRINLEDGSTWCRFDFKTTFSDGTSVVRRDVNVCGLTRYTLTD